MAKRRSEKTVRASKQPESASKLHQALERRTKEELVNALLDLADADHKVHRQLAMRFDLDASADELVASTRRAIADATDFDEREINYNFDYDHDAYSERSYFEAMAAR
jgi:hypothetical protein